MSHLTRVLLIPVVLAVVLGIAGCGAGASGTTTGLQTSTTPAGTAVVDSSGRAVYLYSKDTPGSKQSACTGTCAAEWPAVTAGSGTPEVVDISAKVSVIRTTTGQEQFTLNGWLLYYFDGDTAPGMINGQGAGGVWWLLAPDGTRITEIGR